MSLSPRVNVAGRQALAGTPTSDRLCAARKTFGVKIMRTFIRRALLIAAPAIVGVLALWAGSAIAQDAAPAALADPASAVQAANSGKRPIVAVYTSPPGRRDWSDDMLGKGTLKPGQTAKLKLKAKPDGCKIDFSAMLDNGDTVTKSGVDLCSADPSVAFADR